MIKRFQSNDRTNFKFGTSRQYPTKLEQFKDIFDENVELEVEIEKRKVSQSTFTILD